jgi:hypothetical protein
LKHIDTTSGNFKSQRTEPFFDDLDNGIPKMPKKKNDKNKSKSKKISMAKKKKRYRF